MTASAGWATGASAGAVDEHSRLAYSALLEDERKVTAAEFWTRAQAFFADAGITMRRVLTDNGNDKLAILQSSGQWFRVVK